MTLTSTRSRAGPCSFLGPDGPTRHRLGRPCDLPSAADGSTTPRTRSEEDVLDSIERLIEQKLDNGTWRTAVEHPPKPAASRIPGSDALCQTNA
jgi:hypothetical protein